MPPKRKAQKTSKRSQKTKRPKRSNKKSKPNKSRKKSTFRNKKLKKALPKIPRLSAQERAQGLSRIQKGEYEEGIHQPYVRSGKEIVVNPAYLNSAAYLSGNIPINAEVDIDEMMDTTGDYRPGYEPDPDAKRLPPAVRQKYDSDIAEQKRNKEDDEYLTGRANQGYNASLARLATIETLVIPDENDDDEKFDRVEEALRAAWAEMNAAVAEAKELRSDGLEVLDKEGVRWKDAVGDFRDKVHEERMTLLDLGRRLGINLEF